MKAETIFRKVSVDDRLPDNHSEVYFVIDKDGNKNTELKADPNSYYGGKKYIWLDNDNVIDWLEEQPNMIVLSKEELKKFATDFYYYWHNQKGNNTQDGYDDFLNSKINP